MTLDDLRRTGVRALAGAAALLAAVVILTSLQAGADKRVAIPAAVAMAIGPVLLALRDRRDAAARLVVAITPPGLTAVLLFAAEGLAWQTDLHMIFFATLAMAVILCDWRAIVAATAVVAVHHLLLGLIVPGWVFLNGGSLLRVTMHAVILLCETGILLWTSLQIVGMLDRLARENEEREAIERAAIAQREAERETQRLLLTALGEGLSRLRDGDLGRRVTADFPGAYVSLKSDFNEALGSLSALVDAVAQTASEIHRGADGIAGAAEELARRNESTSISLAQTTGAVAEMTGRLAQTAEAAGRTVARARQAGATMSSGRQTADAAVRAMTRVAESAEGIDGVIEGLDKIAFQTRVLAMNAAVEAGRAGEAGRGFAVVADLVSALAMRAEEEAKRARSQLTTTQAEIGCAVDAVGQIDGALQGIAHDVAEVTRLLEGIAADNQRQADAIAQIESAVSSMDAAGQRSAAMVAETTAAARSLAGEVEMLTTRTGAFRTACEDTNGAKAPAARAPRPLPPAVVAALSRPDRRADAPGAAGGEADWQAF
jgi:methyl-accepting chemotaxis protein